MTTIQIKKYFTKLVFDKTGKKLSAPLLTHAMLAGRDDFWSAYPWAFKEKSDTVTTTSAQETVELPEGFEGLLSVVERTSTNGAKLSKISPDEYDRLVPYSSSHSNDTPKYYSVSYNRDSNRWQLYLYPTPNAAISLYIKYHTMEDGDEIPKKYTAAFIAAIGKYLTMPGTQNRATAMSEFMFEVERLKKIDSPDNEDISRFLTPEEAGQSRPAKWYEDWTT